MPHERCIDILQAPAGDYGIIAHDDETRENTEIAHPLPCRSVRQFGIGTCRIGLRPASDDKFANHAGNAQQQYASYIDQDEDGTAILACHIGETPHVTQTYGRTRCGKDNAKTTAKICSLR